MIGFDLKTIYEPWCKNESTVEKWLPLQSMKDSRANFAYTVVDNNVYVFGGIGNYGPNPENAHEVAVQMSDCRFEN